MVRAMSGNGNGNGSNSNHKHDRNRNRNCNCNCNGNERGSGAATALADWLNRRQRAAATVGEGGTASGPFSSISTARNAAGSGV